jgi:hypothetical protein
MVVEQEAPTIMSFAPTNKAQEDSMAETATPDSGNDTPRALWTRSDPSAPAPVGGEVRAASAPDNGRNDAAADGAAELSATAAASAEPRESVPPPTAAPVAPEPYLPPGWYDVENRVNTRGYWDGQRWTGDFVPKDSPAVPAAVAPGVTGASKNGLIIALVGFAALAAGSLGPWVSAGFASVSGMSGDGKLTLPAAVIGAGALFLGGSGGGTVFSALLGLAGLGISIADLIHVSNKTSEVTFAGVQIAHVGWGLYVCTGGAVLAIVGSLMHRSVIRAS